MIPDLTPEGFLPRGRFLTDRDEVDAYFVKAIEFKDSTTRAAVWADFHALIDLVGRLKVRIPAVFLAGSFTTNMANPSDTDSSILVDSGRISSGKTWDNLAKISRTSKTDLKLKADTFFIPWFPEGDHTCIPPNYLLERGRWDDFWQRHVTKADRLPPQRHHAMPVRGYLEVIIDDYK